jgi:hypothetical protein
MAKHRVSFWKTVTASAAAMFALMALMAGLLAWGWNLPTGAASWTTYLGYGLAALFIVPLTAASGLIAVGGLIALRRDSRETKGQPYAQASPREATPSLPIAALRTMLGRRRFGFCPGDLVEIRSLDEILQTLDGKGTVDGVPFMPEMAAYCGTRARVFRRVDKLNDWIRATGIKRMHGLVLLGDLRCDGSAHGKCQSNCHLRWRQEWLRPADRAGSAEELAKQAPPQQTQLPALRAFASRQDDTGAELRYVCQATELTAGGAPMRLFDPRHYARDFLTGNVRLRPLFTGLAITFFIKVQRMCRGALFPSYAVGISTAQPQDALDLQPGELVRVKPKSLIEPTLNSASRNRGLYFDRDMIRFCGSEHRVKTRVDRVIIEKTGELRLLTNPCIILDGVTATGEYQGFNPENEYIFWREVWLERVEPSRTPSAARGEPRRVGHSK